MKLLSPAISSLARLRSWRIEAWIQHPISAQREVLQDLVTAAQFTEFGRQYEFSKLFTTKAFKQAVPIHEYEDIKPYVERIMAGEQNLLWNTPINWFAKSSGTTSDKSKFIPVSQESLEDGHFKAAKDVLSLYYMHNPESDLLTGKGLMIGGSHTINNLQEDTHFGDLSAVLMQNTPFYGNWIRTPELRIALMDEWEGKIEKLAQTTMNFRFGCAHLDHRPLPKDPGIDRQKKHERGMAIPGALFSWRCFLSSLQGTIQKIDWRRYPLPGNVQCQRRFLCRPGHTRV
jgi:hypothetical protein